MENILEISQNAKRAKTDFVSVSSAEKNAILNDIAIALDKNRSKIKDQNSLDVEAAKKSNMSEAMIDRLVLDDKRIDGMIKGIKDIIELDDPLNRILEETKRPNGLLIRKISVAIGVLCVIYESRPNVSIDVAALCIKSGNVVILKGGKEAFNSNKILINIVRMVIEKKKYNPDFVKLIETTDREAVKSLLSMNEYIDLVIPRGGESLIRMVTENSKIPVLKHYKGVCHVYVDKHFNREMAINIIVNGKCQRPGVCNAVETLLVHKDVAREFLPVIAEKLIDLKVKLRVCEKSFEILNGHAVEKATEADWYAEYLDLILAVKIVEDVEEAVNHINKYGSAHSDCIVSTNEENSRIFLNKVDSAVVYHNASTRFTDGYEFGKGAEIGISTDRLHARGPVGLEELTTYKYVVFGTGQVRG